MKLGFLHLGLMTEGGDARKTIDDVVRYACAIERCGFDSIWLGEHYDAKCAWGSCLLPISIIAGETTRIKVGSAGVLLVAYNPLALASDISLIQQQYPDRVEIGIARGVPTLVGNKNLLVAAGSRSLQDIFEKKLKLLFYLFSDGKARSDIQVIPAPLSKPALTILGSGHRGHEFARMYEADYIHSLFHGFSSSSVPAGSRAIAVAGLCATTSSENYLEQCLPGFVATSISGTADDCWEQICCVGRHHGVNEVIFVDCGHPDNYLDTVEALARARDRTCRQSTSSAPRSH